MNADKYDLRDGTHAHPYQCLHEEINKEAGRIWLNYGGKQTSKQEEIDNWLEAECLIKMRL